MQRTADSFLIYFLRYIFPLSINHNSPLHPIYPHQYQYTAQSPAHRQQLMQHHRSRKDRDGGGQIGKYRCAGNAEPRQGVTRQEKRMTLLPQIYQRINHPFLCRNRKPKPGRSRNALSKTFPTMKKATLPSIHMSSAPAIWSSSENQKEMHSSPIATRCETARIRSRARIRISRAGAAGVYPTFSFLWRVRK